MHQISFLACHPKPRTNLFELANPQFAFSTKWNLYLEFFDLELFVFCHLKRLDEILSATNFRSWQWHRRRWRSCKSTRRRRFPRQVTGGDGCGADARRYDAGSSARCGGAGCAGHEGGGCRRFWCDAQWEFGARRCRAGCAGVLRVFD